MPIVPPGWGEVVNLFVVGFHVLCAPIPSSDQHFGHEWWDGPNGLCSVSLPYFIEISNSNRPPFDTHLRATQDFLRLCLHGLYGPFCSAVGLRGYPWGCCCEDASFLAPLFDVRSSELTS